ncbi:hypothetical protein DH2020_002298 [Rehmannia glutinosa]|uniref:Methyltransferase n=1 Tax=Rehmannia glutinosa TaxID=99300 RepID=A0ABR0XTC2_REHGL
MATWGGLTHYLSLKTKKTNLYYMAVTTVLCSIFYLIGIWQHGGATASTTLLPSLPCNNNDNPSSSIKDTTNNIPTINATALDFTAHHTAEQLVLLSPAARVVHFPSCDPNLSEYTPCQDTKRSLKFEREMLMYRERHCPEKNEMLKCRIPAPYGYKTPFRWPESRDMVWYANVPHKHLTVEKAGQNWVRFEGDRFSFPGGGTMFPRGADAYIDDIGKLINLGDGSIRTAIDTGCGVASWGAYLLSRNILPMSFAPKDTHEAQVQFALERGVPAQIGIMATNRLPYPSRAFDIAHCSRCLIPWGQYDGLYLIEVDRVLRPGGYWILSGAPVNWENHWKGWNRTREDLDTEQKGIESVARSLCWKKLIQKNDLAIWQKATNHLHYKAIDSQLAEPGRYRNLLDMNAQLGGFAAALVDDPVWVMNVVPVEAELNTLGVIYERGLIGTYQNWCEAMSTYPRTYDFIHANSIFTLYKDRMTDHEGGPHVREKLLIATKQYWTAPDQDQQVTKPAS